MSEGVTGLPPAGWYPDPRDPSTRRWWDGAAWSSHVAPLEPVASVEPALTRRQLREQAGPLTQGDADNGLSAVAVLDRPAEISSHDYALLAGGYTPKPIEPVGFHATEPVWLGSPQTLPGWFIAFSPLWYAGVGILVGFIGRLLSAGAEPPVLAVPSLITFGLILVALGREDGKRMIDRGYRGVAAGWALLPIVYLIMRTVSTGWRGAGMLITYVVLQLLFVALAVFAVLAIVFATNPSLLNASPPAAPAGSAASDVWPVALSPDQRAYLLTPGGMTVGVAHALEGTLVVDGAACTAFGDSMAGSTTQCLIAAPDGQWVAVLSLTPDAPDAAFTVVDLYPVDDNGAVES